jgi:5-methyltetrahydropteroyltriglutamate--homocysteine methyltransferase
MAAINKTLELFVMALAHSLGFPRIGRDRELKKAQEAFWKGELIEAGLRAVGRELRKAHWGLQKNAGIELLPVGDFAWYDQVLTHSLMFGVIPERFRPARWQSQSANPVRHGPWRQRQLLRRS